MLGKSRRYLVRGLVLASASDANGRLITPGDLAAFLFDATLCYRGAFVSGRQRDNAEVDEHVGLGLRRARSVGPTYSTPSWTQPTP